MNFSLFVHIIGAVVTAGMILGAIYSVATRRTQWQRPLAIGIAAMGALQIITGSIVSYQVASGVGVFCARVGVYAAIIVASEIMLMVATRKVVLFPARSVAVLSAVGLIVAAGTAAFLIG